MSANPIIPLVEEAKSGKRKAGRLPAKDSKGHAIKMALAEWRLTPQHLREPKTLGALADKLDVHRKTLAYYDRQTPKSPEEFIDAIDRGAIGRYYPEAVEAIGRKASQGNIEAFKAFSRTVVEPRRPEPQRTSGMDPQLGDAIRRLFSPKDNLTITAEKTRLQIEAKSTKSDPNGTNIGQLPAFVESTS